MGLQGAVQQPVNREGKPITRNGIRCYKSGTKVKPLEKEGFETGGGPSSRDCIEPRGPDPRGTRVRPTLNEANKREFAIRNPKSQGGEDQKVGAEDETDPSRPSKTAERPVLRERKEVAWSVDLRDTNL